MGERDTLIKYDDKKNGDEQVETNEFRLLQGTQKAEGLGKTQF